jgi:hypothetical protein
LREFSHHRHDGSSSVSQPTMAADSNTDRKKKDLLSGIGINSNGGVYRKGAVFSLEKKVEVALVLKRLQKEYSHVSTHHLARETKVSQKFAKKIIDELAQGQLKPNATNPTRQKTGAGSRALTEEDKTLLLLLRNENPTRTLEDYRRELLERTGTVVSQNTICQWFLRSSKQYERNLAEKAAAAFSKDISGDASSTTADASPNDLQPIAK